MRRAELLATVAELERVRPWNPTSSAPMFMRSLRDLAGENERVELSPRQASWLAILMERAEQIERDPARPPPVIATNQSNEADTGNVVRFRRVRREQHRRPAR